MRFMILTLLQVIPKENNVAFWLMMAVFIIIVLLVAKRYIKHAPSSNNATKDTSMAAQQFKEDTPINKPIKKPTNKIQQLKELKEMLDNGILTEEEFNIEKTKILSAN